MRKFGPKPLLKPSVADPDSDLFRSPGSGSVPVLGMRFRIQQQRNGAKLTNKHDFQSFKMAFVPMQVPYVLTYRYHRITYIKYVF
jgi:hypothetical protein